MKQSARHNWCIKLFLSCSITLFAYSTLCQCPDKKFFQSKIQSVYNSAGIDNASQLRQLLSLQHQMKDCRLDDDSTSGFLLQKIGVLHYKQANLTVAVEFTKAAISKAKTGLQNGNRCNLLLIDCYYNLQYFYDLTQDLEKKYDAIDSCLAYSLINNAGFERSVPILLNKVEYLYNKGEYSFCIRDARLGINIIQKYYHSKDSIGHIVSFTTHLLNSLLYSNDTATAERLLNRQVIEFTQSKNTNHLGGVYGLLGTICMAKKKYDKALYYFQNACHIFSLIKFKNGYAQNLANIGILYGNYFNQPDKGLKYCFAALEYADGPDSLAILKETGNIYALKGECDRAQSCFQQAFNTVQPGMDETTILKNSFLFPGFDVLQMLLQLIIEKGDVYVRKYYQSGNADFLEKALNVYKKGDLFLAKIKNEQQLQFSSNLVWRTIARNLYDHAIAACYAKNDIGDAFYFFEKSRAVLLNDQINEQRWMADMDIAEQARVKKIIIELERTLANLLPGSEEYLVANKKLYTYNQQLTLLVRNLKSKNPLFYQNYLDTGFITVPQLQKNVLNNSKTLVEIFSGDSAVYVLTIAPKDQTLTKIDKHVYDSLVHVFNSFVTDFDRLNNNMAGFTKISSSLYHLLFQKTTPPDGSVIISPDGVSYPFEALVVKENGHQPDYFLNHYAASYTYSVKYLTLHFAANSSNGNSVLGIAPVQYKKFDLPELFQSDYSLKTIGNYFTGSTNYVFEKATKSNFLQNFSRYNIIQLYTHASDTSSNNDPVIYFSDSMLFLSDLIPDRKSYTQLVVLSACETANGKLYIGEGIFSFNRGFAALGIPAAVSTLWSVKNESIYRITELFYKYLSQQLPTDIALQKAKLEFINSSPSQEKKLPYFWAGSILTGKVNIIRTNPGFPFTSVIIGMLLLWGAAYFSKKYFTKKINKGGLS